MDSDNTYDITIPEHGGETSSRSFTGAFYNVSWTFDRIQCIYAGNIQGGPEIRDMWTLSLLGCTGIMLWMTSSLRMATSLDCSGATCVDRPPVITMMKSLTYVQCFIDRHECGLTDCHSFYVAM